MIAKVKPIPQPKPTRAYTPTPHPQQVRIDAMRVVPSLVTHNTSNIPQGK